MSPLSEPKPEKLKSREPLNISYTNRRGQRPSDMCNNKPDLFALCESNLHGGIVDTDFLVPGYLAMHRNDTWRVCSRSDCKISMSHLCISEWFCCIPPLYSLHLPFTIFTILLRRERCFQQFR